MIHVRILVLVHYYCRSINCSLCQILTNTSSSTLNESEPWNKIFYMKYISNIIINVELYLNCTFFINCHSELTPKCDYAKLTTYLFTMSVKQLPLQPILSPDVSTLLRNVVTVTSPFWTCVLAPLTPSDWPDCPTYICSILPHRSFKSVAVAFGSESTATKIPFLSFSIGVFDFYFIYFLKVTLVST